MAVDDVIVRAGPVAVPLDYTVPNGTEIIPRSISASINGGSAGGAFVPVLEIIAPSGAVTAYCARRIEIAAGASVLVSWFPGVADPDEQQATPAGITSVSSDGTLSVNNTTGPAVTVALPLTGVVAGSYGDASDVAQLTLDAEGRVTAASSVPIAGGGSVVASDGWVPDTTETWTFVSFAAGPPAVGTFTVPGDLRAKYTVGTRIKLVQTTTKYFVVTADPTFAAGVTTVTISGGTDYTLANAAISANYHSYVVNPQGYPDWFNFNPASTGFASKAVDVAQFSVCDRNCSILCNSIGTSNATTLTITLPIAASAFAIANLIILISGVDNGATLASPGRAFPSSSTAMTLNKTMAGGAWTNVGQKGATLVGAYAV